MPPLCAMYVGRCCPTSSLGPTNQVERRSSAACTLHCVPLNAQRTLALTFRPLRLRLLCALEGDNPSTHVPRLAQMGCWGNTASAPYTHERQDRLPSSSVIVLLHVSCNQKARNASTGTMLRSGMFSGGSAVGRPGPRRTKQGNRVLDEQAGGERHMPLTARIMAQCTARG